MKSLLALVTLATMAAAAHANVSFPINHRGALDQNGVAVASGTLVKVIDLDGDGWDGIPYVTQGTAPADNASDWQWDPDDLIIGIFSFGGTNPQAASNNNITVDSHPEYTANVDHWYSLFFNIPNNPDGPGPGTYYYAIDNGTVPAPGGTDSGSQTTPVGPMNLQTVPEPASAVLAVIGGVMLLAGRRERTRA